ncbi:hypothetical protein E2C01_039122 [Portunus trituberculatus]|uniref:Uncharacterized protein n=1 Tax=Portunus trituberculatus TaxID=210409 RepID=A0A5B7FLW5_PORTR|nr:hypothetical protein [Portunus trituberculatus]
MTTQENVWKYHIKTQYTVHSLASLPCRRNKSGHEGLCGGDSRVTSRLGHASTKSDAAPGRRLDWRRPGSRQDARHQEK